MRYFINIQKWSENAAIDLFYFSSFDESWKGSPEPLEPEKHWGLFYEDRTPKKVINALYSELIPADI